MNIFKIVGDTVPNDLKLMYLKGKNRAGSFR